MSQLPPSQPSSRREHVHGLVDAFFDRDTFKDQMQTADMLKNMLRADHPFQKPASLLPDDEIELRYDFAKQLEKKIQMSDSSFRLNAAHVSVILTVPLSALGNGGWLSPKDTDSITLEQKLNGMLNLVKHFTQNFTNKGFGKLSISASRTNSRKSQRTSRSGSARRQDDPDEDWVPDDANRNPTEKNLCRDRDRHACVVMSTANPEVCHIVPFAWNENQKTIKKTQSVLTGCQAFFGNEWFEEYLPYLAKSDNPGGSDKYWNMLCLNRQLHFWWAQKFLAFKCLGITSGTNNTSTVEFQFNWMLRDKRNPKQEMQLYGDNNDFMKMVERVKDFNAEGNPAHVSLDKLGQVAATRVDSGIPIRSGHVFYVVMPDKDALKFKAMMDLQWACIVVAGMSGAAGSPDLLIDPDDDELELRTESWVAQQARQSLQRQRHDHRPEPREHSEPLALRPITNRPARNDSPTKQSQRTQQSQISEQASRVVEQPENTRLDQ
ncbi:hypothetical protein NW762_000641 [Fusarium torreyae]|uniref:HNH nuclease domain-containing protein n=1 Tax=Fusarium torreyae TaxID=1237075 RepID=A0A9W8SGS7_9HYPO|nr:hypothetical protein NW762_000641 [Fusarium torreyae]